ncbi:MAG: SLBB domain-containing protein [Muribaculaceae bacterium]|nr:SLBB domain-containing protein [Muribaculaceae bacterium]
MAFALTVLAMTDDEVISYIRAQSANGKTEQQIGQELMAQGVSAAQVRRIKSKYRQEGSNTEGTAVVAQSAALQDNGDGGRVHTAEQESGPVVDSFAPDARDEAAREVYGHDIFSSRNLSFEPSSNLATPKNYRLGPGDEVVIDMWGAAEDHLRETISPEGSIMISKLGPVHLNGKTIDEANKYIKNLFARKYAGLTDEQTDIDVTLGNVRSIQIDIMGEVTTPGTYRLSPFSNVFHALYNAGGINNIGSMRNISVLRNGKRIANVDVYDYLFKGKQTGNIRLQEGDVIIVPPYENIVSISGNVKRPMYYEVKPDETVATLLDYAGGFSGDAYSGMVRLSRQNGADNDLYNVDKGEFATYRLQDGDVVMVGNVLDRFSNRVELKGAVTRPGLYALGNGTRTLRDLLNKADGLTDDAYLGRALIYRQGPDLSLEVIPIDLGAIQAGTEPDIELQKNDIVDISSVQSLYEKGDYTIDGYVTRPGTYSYMANTTVEDLILRAGGLREGACTARIEISRRIVSPTATWDSPQLVENYTVEMNGGLGAANSSARSFILEPYDRVVVRKSPAYHEQQYVSVEGEVLFPGSYTLTRRNERLSELVRRSGGLVDGAYAKGAYLQRKLTDDEVEERQNVLKLAYQNQAGQDSIPLTKMEVATTYNVGIDLPKALANPGTAADLVLQPGDYLFVPEQQSTVKVSGEVMYANTVIYEPGMKLDYYVNQSGGFGERAKKNKCFIIYMNGQIAKMTSKTVIEPGSHIIVPAKKKNDINLWEKIIPLISGVGSLATLSAALATLIK